MRLSEFAVIAARRMARLRPADAIARHPLPRGPLTHGAAGIALFFAELARLSRGKERERAADRAQAWIDAVRRLTLHNPDTAFPRARWTVFHGAGGVENVAALVAAVRDDRRALRAAAVRFLAVWRVAERQRDLRTEAYQGAAGFLLGARDLEAHQAALGPDLCRRLRSAAEAAHARVIASLAEAARTPLRRGTLLGYGHGLAGEIDAALAWDPRPSSVVARALERLRAEAVAGDGLIAWPPIVGDAPTGEWWASFCNGVSGHLYLWCRAYEVFGDRRYLTTARLAAQTVATLRCWEPSVCCGTAGQALALDRYFRFTGDPRYRRRAAFLARRACADLSTGTANLSYFSGLSGIAHLALALGHDGSPYLPLVDGPSRAS